MIPGSTGWPVPYPASMAEGSAAKGVQQMIARVEARVKACPNTKIVLGGHSQGGGVTAGTIPKLSKEALEKVIAVTMFGSPPCPAAVQGRCKSYCNSGDNICEGGGKGKGGKGGKGGAPAGKSGASPGGAAPKSAPPADHMMRFDIDLMEELQRGGSADCAGQHSPEKVEDRGHHATGSSESPHLLYNKGKSFVFKRILSYLEVDGYYVRAATCYIMQAWKKAGGK
jgi:hypothetical protein